MEVLAVVLGILFIVFFLFVEVGRKQRHFRRRWSSGRSFGQWRGPVTDHEQQLRAVLVGSFEKQRVMNASEYRVFAIVENEIAVHAPGFRVFAQTSLGEILRSNNADAFASINSKRVDILVIDRSGLPFMAIEYQGEGHYVGTGAARDAVKREALRKAGVRYIEFRPGDTDQHIRWRLRDEFGIKSAQPGKV
jgi:hypothetical protein